MADQPFRSALFNKDKLKSEKFIQTDLNNGNLVQILNDLLYASVSVKNKNKNLVHPVCVINSIKNIIGDDRSNPSSKLLKFAVDYIFQFKFRKKDQSLIKEIRDRGIAKIVFLSDLEDACQDGDWTIAKTILTELFLASDQSRAAFDALIGIALQNIPTNGLVSYHILRAFQFQDLKEDYWTYTKSIFGYLEYQELPDPHISRELIPDSFIDKVIKSGNILLFSAINRIWLGDYTREKDYQREISHWLGELSSNSMIETVLEENHKLKNIDSKFFIKRAEKIIFGKETEFEKAEKLIRLEAIRSFSRYLNDYQMSLIAKRYEHLL